MSVAIYYYTASTLIIALLATWTWDRYPVDDASTQRVLGLYQNVHRLNITSHSHPERSDFPPKVRPLRAGAPIIIYSTLTLTGSAPPALLSLAPTITMKLSSRHTRPVLEANRYMMAIIYVQ